MEGTIHVDRALTDVSLAVINADLVSDQVFPSVPVQDKTGIYYVYGKERFRVRDDRRAPGDETQRSRLTIAEATYTTAGHGLKDYVPREKGAEADPALDLLIDTTEVLTDQVRLNKEAALVAALVAGLTSTSTINLTSTQWDEDANDPIKKVRTDAETIAKRIGRKPNVLAVNPDVWMAIQFNANIRGLLTGIGNLSSANITPAAVAALMGLDEIIIAGALYDSAYEGRTASLTYVWPSATCGALLFYRARSVGRKSITLGATFRWTKAISSIGGGAGGAQYVERYWWQPNHSDVVEVLDWYGQNIMCADAGIRYQNAV